MHRAFDPRLWQGRDDADEGELAVRWHQRVRPLQQADAPGTALLGFACDAGVRRNQGRPGAAEGPEALRRALANLAWHQQRPLYDAGDVVCAGDDLEAAQAELGGWVARLIAAGHRPLVLGGGHEVAFGTWQGVAARAARQRPRQPAIGIVNLDAHFDLRAGPPSSGTPFRQIAAECEARGWPFRYLCLGIAEPANTAALFARARELGVRWRLDEDLEPRHLPAAEAELAAFLGEVDWVQLSVDLDALPGHTAPGVSAPAARGVEFGVVEALVGAVLASGKLAAAEVAELNPRFDPDHRTARAAARLAYRLAGGVG